MEPLYALALIIFGFLILAILFVLIRDLMLWYWRVNETLSLLKSIDKRLGLILGQKENSATETPKIVIESPVHATEKRKIDNTTIFILVGCLLVVFVGIIVGYFV